MRIRNPSQTQMDEWAIAQLSGVAVAGVVAKPLLESFGQWMNSKAGELTDSMFTTGWHIFFDEKIWAAVLSAASEFKPLKLKTTYNRPGYLYRSVNLPNKERLVIEGAYVLRFSQPTTIFLVGEVSDYREEFFTLFPKVGVTVRPFPGRGVVGLELDKQVNQEDAVLPDDVQIGAFIVRHYSPREAFYYVMVSATTSLRGCLGPMYGWASDKLKRPARLMLQNDSAAVLVQKDQEENNVIQSTLAELGKRLGLKLSGSTGKSCKRKGGFCEVDSTVYHKCLHCGEFMSYV